MKALKLILLMALMMESSSAYEDREEPTAEESRVKHLQKFDKNEDDESWG